MLLLRPFGFTTVSVWVYQLAAENFWSLAALPALLIVLLALVPVVLLFRQVRAPTQRRAVGPVRAAGRRERPAGPQLAASPRRTATRGRRRRPRPAVDPVSWSR